MPQMNSRVISSSILGIDAYLAKMEAMHTFDFQDNLSILGDNYKRIYDDGEIFVLDLDKPK